MPVEVRLPTLLRPAAGGQATLSVEGATVREVLEVMGAAHPELSSQLLTDDGALHRFVNVYVDDDDVRYLDGLDTKLPGDAVVSILPAVAGGAR